MGLEAAAAQRNRMVSAVSAHSLPPVGRKSQCIPDRCASSLCIGSLSCGLLVPPLPRLT